MAYFTPTATPRCAGALRQSLDGLMVEINLNPFLYRVFPPNPSDQSNCKVAAQNQQWAMQKSFQNPFVSFGIAPCGIDTISQAKQLSPSPKFPDRINRLFGL
jgi:hypothetical protein